MIWNFSGMVYIVNCNLSLHLDIACYSTVYYVPYSHLFVCIHLHHWLFRVWSVGKTKITVSSATTNMSMLWYSVFAVVRAQHCAWPTDLFAQDLPSADFSLILVVERDARIACIALCRTFLTSPSELLFSFYFYYY